MLDISKMSLTVSGTIFTWGEYKEYALPIIEAAFKYLESAKEKISIFAGKSFDKMCVAFEKSLNSIKSSKLADNDKNELLRILAQYKGKRSSDKLAAKEGLAKYINQTKNLSVQLVKTEFERIKKDFYAKKHTKFYSFKKALEENAKSLKDDDVVDSKNLKSISDNIVKKYSKHFSGDQVALVDAVINGINGRVGTIEAHFATDLSKLPSRTIAIYLRDYMPHAEKSQVLADFCKKCEDELKDNRFSEENRLKLKRPELTDKDPKNIKDVDNAVKEGKKALKEHIDKMQEYLNEAKKLA